MKKIVPLYHEDILRKYKDVLHRSKYPFQTETVDEIIEWITKNGIQTTRLTSDETFTDLDDLVFYEVVLSKRDDDAYLVTGNQKHFPKKPFIVTPSEMVNILGL